MACIFAAPGCSGPRSPTGECPSCAVLAADPELEAMAAIFPLHEMQKQIAPILARANRAPMPAVPIYPGTPDRPGKPGKAVKHVNKAAVAGASFQLSALTRSAGDQNCALCACAGGVNLAVGYVKFTTKKVAKLHGVEDGYKALGKREEQEQKIIRFVSANLPPGYHHVVHGSDANRLDLQSALQVMKGYPDGTVFVVSTTGGISKGGVELSKTSWGHWLNAVKKDGEVVFVDFQTDHEQRLGRGFVSSQPILGNFGVEWDNPRMQVIAFVPPPDAPPNAPSGASGSATTATAPTALAPLPMPVLPGTSTQQVVPLSPEPWQGPSRRQLKGRGVNLGKGDDVQQKFNRQARLFDKY